MSKPVKPIPRFKNEAAERAFWETKGNDSGAYLDWSRAKAVAFEKLQPSTKAISLRLPVALLDRIRLEARKLDVPYQSLMKIWLAEKIAAPEKRKR